MSSTSLPVKALELVALARQYGYRPEELAEIIAQVPWGASGR